MRKDITLNQVDEYKTELESIFASMVYREALQQAYDDFRQKTGIKLTSFTVPVMDINFPNDRFYGETSKVFAPTIEYEEHIQ